MPKGRPGGNPDFGVKYKFEKLDPDLVKSHKITFRLSPEEMAKAKQIPGLTKKFREWLNSL